MAAGNGGKVFGDDHGCGFGEPRCGRVLLIGNEGDFSGAGLLDAVEAGDLGVGGAVVEARVEGMGDLRKFHGGWRDASKSYTSCKVVHRRPSVPERVYLFITGYPPPPSIFRIMELSMFCLAKSARQRI